MFLSIIIPVYNAEKTISRCLDSIWSQRLPEDNYEVICVDDCSSDSSIKVLDRIAAEHPQLKIFRNSENLRAGGARNHGVRKAEGEYILFLDSDDYFHEGGLKKAFEFQKQHRLDILVCDFARHSENAPNNTLVHQFKSTDVMTGREFLVINSLPYAPWKYLFKRSLMIENDVFFAEKVSCEDVDWSHKIAFYAQKMQYQPILLTHYILVPTSQTGSGYKKASTVFHWLMAGKRMAELSTLYKEAPECKCIMNVANQTTLNGLLFFCGLFSNPITKAKMIRTNIPAKYNWCSKIIRIRQNAIFYGVMSTAISPLFRTALFIKRRILGR